MVKKYLLTSKYGIALASFLSFLSISIFICLCIFYKEVGFLPIIITILFIILSLLGTTLCFKNKIIINTTKKELIVTNFKRIRIPFSEIEDIKVSTENSLNPKKYCKIVVSQKNSPDLEIAGFLSIFKNHDVQKTLNIVKEIKNTILFLNTKKDME